MTVQVHFLHWEKSHFCPTSTYFFSDICLKLFFLHINIEHRIQPSNSEEKQILVCQENNHIRYQRSPQFWKNALEWLTTRKHRECHKLKGGFWMSMAMIPQNWAEQKYLWAKTLTSRENLVRWTTMTTTTTKTRVTFWFTNRTLEKTCSVAAAKLPLQWGFITFGDPYCFWRQITTTVSKHGFSLVESI